MAYLSTWKPYKINQILGKYYHSVPWIRNGYHCIIIYTVCIRMCWGNHPTSTHLGHISTKLLRTKSASNQLANWKRKSSAARNRRGFQHIQWLPFWEPRKRWAGHRIPQWPLTYHIYIAFLGDYKLPTTFYGNQKPPLTTGAVVKTSRFCRWLGKNHCDSTE